MKIFALTFFFFSLFSQESVSGNIGDYRKTCKEAAEKGKAFASFRKNPHYSSIVECGRAPKYAHYLKKYARADSLKKIPEARLLDAYGSPALRDSQYYGMFSGTTLRYLLVADQILRFFYLPAEPVIGEIGAGFGGQCYLFHLLCPFKKYFMYDLPETELLIEKMLKILNVPSTKCLPLDAPLPVDTIDLLISNYAFSECSIATQMSYIERVVSKADRGYMLYNDLKGLPAAEFVAILEKMEKQPRVYNEPVFTSKHNVLIIWDSTRQRW